jgi:tetratricopeptide (TPR) repeat protein
MNTVKSFFIVSLVALVLGSLPVSAQNKRNALRDSLQAATDQLAYHPDSIALRLRKASWNVELEQWEYAKDEYDRVLNQDPTNLDALYFRAFVNQKMNRYNFARLDLEHLLRLCPGSFEGQLALALLNQKDLHKTEALDQINNVVANFPDSAVAWASRAGMEMEYDMLDAAEYDYSEALKLEPTNKDYWMSRADVRIKLGRLSEARKDLDEMVRLGTPRASLIEWYKKTRKQ